MSPHHPSHLQFITQEILDILPAKLRERNAAIYSKWHNGASIITPAITHNLPEISIQLIINYVEE